MLTRTPHRELDLAYADPGADVSRVGVGVGFALDEKARQLHAYFQVRSPTLNVNGQLSRDSSQWGLWDWDVVELFVTARGAESLPHYYEFQVSPLNQFLELEILEPRVRVNRDFVSGFGHASMLDSPDRWLATMTIPLDSLGWDGKASSIVGNAFAILGHASARSYWGLTLPRQDKPDFHLPRHFAPLLADGAG